MSRDQRQFLAQLFGLDELLGRRGFPRFSPWWRQTLEDFYLSGARQAVIRKGRRVGASTIVGVRVAVCEALHGQHQFSPGDRAAFPFISVRRDEAAKRLANIKAILDTIGVRYSPSGDTIRLTDRPIDFAVLTASFKTAVGDTCIGLWCDEVTRWSDVETGANPAREVLASVRPTIATLPNARMWLVSSPLAKSDAHFDAFERGSDEFQRCYFGETWTINPSLSEADCRKLEPHEPTFQREYGAIPSEGALENYFGELAITQSIDKNRTAPEPFIHGITYHVGTDAAFQQDRFGVAVVTSQVGEWDDQACARVPPRVTRVQETHAWKPDRSPSLMAVRLRHEVCRRYATDRVYIDQFSSEAFKELCRQIGLHATVIPWTGGDGEESKAERFRAVRLAMLEGSLRIPDDPELLRDLRSVRSVLTPAGNERIVIPRTTGGHGDRVSAMVLAASEALKRRPELAPSRESTFERILREQSRLHIPFSGGGVGLGLGLADSEPAPGPAMLEAAQAAYRKDYPHG